ncbi:hypothetical protein [Raoultella ornithinolytica]|uniref:hypothetical protein n=1 Tax=Raoultella ornithinolytica TaxID=54291 RepID=UPI00234FE464|nr:hypothetical protein [Raoultella ornithinolytica]MDC7944489.1 hypothetical protein [Raoultella ornithinolytica]
MTTDITELAQREKFEAWWEREYKHLESSKYTDAVPHIKYGFWMAYQAGGAELVEVLEKEQRYTEELREWNAGLAQESCEHQQRIVELENQLKAAENNEIDARCRIAELEESHAQVIQSRDHYKRMTEEGLKQLAESRTVKLPELCVGVVQGGHAVMVPYAAGHWFNKTAILEMLAAAGIKVEAE